jgi:hypothetical protein
VLSTELISVLTVDFHMCGFIPRIITLVAKGTGHNICPGSDRVDLGDVSTIIQKHGNSIILNVGHRFNSYILRCQLKLQGQETVVAVAPPLTARHYGVGR